MGAGYGGTGGPLTYQESADFILNGNSLLIDLLGQTSLGDGFDSAKCQILSDGNLIDNYSFNTLGSAQTFFSNNLLDIPLSTGLDNIELLFDATMSGGDGFAFDYAAAGSPSVAPLPSSWIMMLTGLGGLGLLGWRKKRKAQPVVA